MSLVASEGCCSLYNVQLHAIHGGSVSGRARTWWFPEEPNDVTLDLNCLHVIKTLVSSNHAMIRALRVWVCGCAPLPPFHDVTLSRRLCARVPGSSPCSCCSSKLPCFSSLFLACFLVFRFLVLFIFTGGLQKTKFFATIPRVEVISSIRFKDGFSMSYEILQCLPQRTWAPWRPTKGPSQFWPPTALPASWLPEAKPTGVGRRECRQETPFRVAIPQTGLLNRYMSPS